MSVRRRFGLLLFSVPLAMGASGCGAMVARAKIVGAETALVAARRADAEKKAPYDYMSAQLYLQKAREEEAYARFGPAIEFGGLAEKHAEQAKLSAGSAEPEPTP